MMEGEGVGDEVKEKEVSERKNGKLGLDIEKDGRSRSYLGLGYIVYGWVVVGMGV